MRSVALARGTPARIALARSILVHSTLVRALLLRMILSCALFLFGCNSPASARTGKRRAIIAVLHHL